MHVSEIVVFPIKSLRGITLPECELQVRGLRDDRRWMLVDENGDFLSQRSDARLALFEVGFAGRLITVAYDGRALEFNRICRGPYMKVSIWRKKVYGKLVSAEADAWFSEALGKPVRLVRMMATCKRKPSSPESRRLDRVSFADSDPILVASEASLADLNARLAEPVPMRRFRANLVIAGAAAFAEDDWTTLKVGPARIHRTRRCGRCRVTTIDIETGLPGTEPLATLASYRTFGKAACFGSYYVPDGWDKRMIRVGDPVVPV